MLNRCLRFAIMLALCAVAFDAYAQKATELFIPIGESPGLSNKLSLIGTLESVDLGAKSVRVSSASGAQTVTFTQSTPIWLDRSLDKLPNRSGAIADLQQGRKVEIKLSKGEPKPLAEWIKVQASGLK